MEICALMCARRTYVALTRYLTQYLMLSLRYVVSTFLRQAIKQIGTGSTLGATVQWGVRAWVVDGVKTFSVFDHRLLSAFGHRSCVDR